jgi:hypothetical protein
MSANKNRTASLELRIGRETGEASPQPARYDIASLLVEERARVFTREGLALLEETKKSR